MLQKKISWLRMLFSSIVLIAAIMAIQFHPFKVHAEEADYDTFSEAYHNLLREFIHPVKSGELVRGAVKGMDVALTHAKINHTITTPEVTNDPEEDLSKFHETFEQVAAEVTGKVSESDLMTDALRGMFEATGDPYTTYLSPREYRVLSEQMNGGRFGGVGIYIELEKETKQLMVLEPIEKTPAADAGLKSGDYIMKIDGKSTKGIDLDVAQKMIRGPVGSIVTLTIMRKGFSAEKDVAIHRGLIKVLSVSYSLKSGDIGYIHLRTFGEFSGDELEKALNELDNRGAKGYILDLRNNGGGYIDAARAVCSKFLPRGSVIVSVAERHGHVQREIADGSEHPNNPMVVLVNEFSASASEITAGALQDYKRATIVGTRTFGKGSVQTIVRLRNQGAAKITIAHYLTPNGKDIDKKGIVPDAIVSMKGHDLEKSNDEQLQKAINMLKDSIVEGKTGAK